MGIKSERMMMLGGTFSTTDCATLSWAVQNVYSR